METKTKFLEKIDSEIGQLVNNVDTFIQETVNDSDLFSNIPFLLDNAKEAHCRWRIELAFYDEKSKGNFNIYKDLSVNNKFLEMDHSKIIKKLFDKNNSVFPGKEFLRLFVDLINGHKKNNHQGPLKYFDEDYSIECEIGVKDHKELGKIDIFIYENKKNGNCIIIENKITGKADDQDNQLARYCEIAEKLRKKIIAIVYLPFYNNRRPNLKKYYGKYKNYIDQINNLMVIIPAWDSNPKKNFIHGFLEECAGLSWKQNRHTAAVCIEQYAAFLISKGERELMAKNTENKFLEKLLTDIETKKIVEDIVEIWGRKDQSINDILQEKLKSEASFVDGNQETIAYYLNDEVFIFFGLYDNNFQIGFGSKKAKFESTISKNLKDILYLNDFSGYISDIVSEKGWVWGYYNINKLIGTYDNMYNDLLRIIKVMENKAKK